MYKTIIKHNKGEILNVFTESESDAKTLRQLLYVYPIHIKEISTHEYKKSAIRKWINKSIPE